MKADEIRGRQHADQDGDAEIAVLLTIDDDGLTIRHAQVEPHGIEIATFVMTSGTFDGDRTSDEPRSEALEACMMLKRSAASCMG